MPGPLRDTQCVALVADQQSPIDEVGQHGPVCVGAARSARAAVASYGGDGRGSWRDEARVLRAERLEGSDGDVPDYLFDSAIVLARASARA